MKKITLLAAAFVAITFASCKKDRTCSCISDQAGATANKVTYLKARKGDARANCLNSSYESTSFIGTTTTTKTVKVTCTLD